DQAGRRAVCPLRRRDPTQAQPADLRSGTNIHHPTAGCGSADRGPRRDPRASDRTGCTLESARGTSGHGGPRLQRGEEPLTGLCPAAPCTSNRSPANRARRPTPRSAPIRPRSYLARSRPAPSRAGCPGDPLATGRDYLPATAGLDHRANSGLGTDHGHLLVPLPAVEPTLPAVSDRYDEPAGRAASHTVGESPQPAFGPR